MGLDSNEKSFTCHIYKKPEKIADHVNMRFRSHLELIKTSQVEKEFLNQIITLVNVISGLDRWFEHVSSLDKEILVVDLPFFFR